MPLVRVEVRNEYSLGAPELYRETNKEDPKEVLEGVAVAGLVGVLRQLGDLAEFAAQVFHGLQEDVMRTSSRSHKLMARVQRIETALSPLEKALLAQRSHLHFAYTAGSNWHARIRCEQNHFVYSDMPQFIMDSYDDSRGPPRLHLLDRFDPGGPGSCLKRYSDPTFFKRGSVASGEATADRTSKDEKGRKIKKRRSWIRSREVSRDASFSYNSGRMQFTRTNVDGHGSSSQTAPTYDATQRSDFAEQTTSDLRNGSGYVEGDFRPINSVQPKEQDSKESISSSVKRRESDFLDYNFSEEKITDAYDDIQIYPSQEQAGCTSSSSTWGEKNETLEPKTQDSENDGITHENDHNRHLESFSPDLDLERLEPKTQDSENDDITHDNGHNRHLESFFPDLDLETLSHNAVEFRTVDKMDIQPCNQAVRPESGDAHLDDIESETDHFMDALNTSESECETDTDCTKRQEIEHYPNSEDIGVDEGVCEVIRHDLECQSSSSESNDLADSSLINGNCGNNLISLSPKSFHATNSSGDEFNSVSLVDKDSQSSQRAGHSLTPGSPQSVDSHEKDNNVESVLCAVSPNFRDDSPGMPITDGIRTSLESQKYVPETSNVTSVTFWTNGGLLGLQPSKPPECSILNAPPPPRDPAHEKDGKTRSSTHPILSDKDAKQSAQTENFQHIGEDLSTDSSTCCEYQESGTTFRKTLWKIPPADLDIKLGKLGDSVHQNDANITGSSVISSRMFELSNRLLSTGSNKKLLQGEVQNSYPAGYQNVNRTISGQNKYLFGGESHILSPSSSPPLAHMKISFQPIDGFEISKLKLKLPDGNTNSENGSDIFPSFQLVPDQVSITWHNVGSDSDADTFYRSSPSLSNDSHSNRSESNSEQWESSESPTSKDRDLYDALGRISLTESVSTVPENGLQNCESCRSFDTFRKELRNDISPKGFVEPQFVPTPAPPPLPPVHWQVMTTPHLEGIVEKSMSFDHTHSASTISQPKPAPFNEDRIDTTNVQKIKQSSSWKSNGQGETNQGKSIDENEDFLHQIRTKSLNLRPTVNTKPTAVPSGGSAHVQVTAILEKANAIRQAVGSDGEDDGNWSEA